jgi:general secretion pathway protein G
MRRSSTNHFTPARKGPSAFTLVELMIVVIIIGIMATIVIPQFTGATKSAREATLRDDMRFLRTQVQVFRAQHRDIPPGYPGGSMGSTPTQQDFADQMLLYTSELCETATSADATHKLGPYLSRLPANPINDQTTIFMVGNGESIPTDLPVMNGEQPYGWIYKPYTQEWVANLNGNDASGKPYSGY